MFQIFWRTFAVNHTNGKAFSCGKSRRKTISIVMSWHKFCRDKRSQLKTSILSGQRARWCSIESGTLQVRQLGLSMLGMCRWCNRALVGRILWTILQRKVTLVLSRPLSLTKDQVLSQSLCGKETSILHGTSCIVVFPKLSTVSSCRCLT